MINVSLLSAVFSFFNATRGGNTLLARLLEKYKLKFVSEYGSYLIMAISAALVVGNIYYTPFFFCGLWLMMVVAGSKYFPHLMNTSDEPPSLMFVGKYIEKLADKLTDNYMLHKTICLGLTKAVVSLPLILMIAAYKPIALVLIPLMTLQGAAYLVGYNLADRLKKSELRGFFAEHINGAYLGLTIGMVLVYG